uniref:Phospholipid phosphatase related 5b n=1 Tax=Poecilia latipinna TaxID=48699 RepID=A0A3B3UQN3_9TELE
KRSVTFIKNVFFFFLHIFCPVYDLWSTSSAFISSPGVYAFGLFTVDIFVNAGQVVTGNLAPYFLTVCKPNYTALGCQQALRYISHQEACTGNQDDVLRARKTFPSKEAALSIYAALYLAMYVTFTVQAKGTRLAKPVMSLGFMCLAFLTGLNRVAEYRNHWSDVIAGFIIGMAIATFLVVCVVHNFKGKLLLNEDSPAEPQPNIQILFSRGTWAEVCITQQPDYKIKLINTYAEVCF